MGKQIATKPAKELKVIGAGFGRTGTLSLKTALEELGFGPCYHMIELFGRSEDLPRWTAVARGGKADWPALLGGYQATVDWPACIFYEELMEAYPRAKVLLTTRDPEQWYESMYNTIYATSRIFDKLTFPPLLFLMKYLLPKGFHAGKMVEAVIWQGSFKGSFKDKQKTIALFNERIEEVKQRVPPERLLIFNVKEGWEPLCRFLGVEVPENKPFPHVNERAGFIGKKAVQQNVDRLIRGFALAGFIVAALVLLRRLARRKD